MSFGENIDLSTVLDDDQEHKLSHITSKPQNITYQRLSIDGQKILKMTMHIAIHAIHIIPNLGNFHAMKNLIDH